MHYSATFGENVIICYHLANALIAFDTVAPECIMLDIARGILDCTIRRKCYHNVIILLSYCYHIVINDDSHQNMDSCFQDKGFAVLRGCNKMISL